MGKKKSKSRRKSRLCSCRSSPDDNDDEYYKPTKTEKTVDLEQQKQRTTTSHFATSDNQLESVLAHRNEDQLDYGKNKADIQRRDVGEPLDTSSHLVRTNHTNNESYDVENNYNSDAISARLEYNDGKDHVVVKIENDDTSLDDIPYIDDDDGDVEELQNTKKDTHPGQKKYKQATCDTQKTIEGHPNDVTRKLENISLTDHLHGHTVNSEHRIGGPENKGHIELQTIAASIEKKTDTNQYNTKEDDDEDKHEENIDEDVSCQTNVEGGNDTSGHNINIGITAICRETTDDIKCNWEESILPTQHMDTSMNVIDSNKVNVVNDDSSVGNVSDDSNTNVGKILKYQKFCDGNNDESECWNDPEMKTLDPCQNHIATVQIQSNGTDLGADNTASTRGNDSEKIFMTVGVDGNEEHKAGCLDSKDDSQRTIDITDSLNNELISRSFGENIGHTVNDSWGKSLECTSSYVQNDLDASDTDDNERHACASVFIDKESLVGASDSEVKRKESDDSDSEDNGLQVDESDSEVTTQESDATGLEVKGHQVDASDPEVMGRQCDTSGSEVDDQHGNTEKALPELSDNVLFYQNKIYSRPAIGHKVEDMHGWKGDYNQLERNHSYIQWLFPIPGSFGMNHQAQPLQEHEAEEFRKSDELKARVNKSFEMMLDFYGMKLVDGYVEKNETNWQARYDHLNQSFHNRMRITRIIQSIGELGFEQLQSRWLSFLMVEAMVNRSLYRLGGDSMQYFIDAIKEDDERQKFYEKYFRYIQGDFSDVDESSDVKTDQSATTNLKGDGNSISEGYTTADEDENEDANSYSSANEDVYSAISTSNLSASKCSDDEENTTAFDQNNEFQNGLEPDSNARDDDMDATENNIEENLEPQQGSSCGKNLIAKMQDETKDVSNGMGDKFKNENGESSVDRRQIEEQNDTMFTHKIEMHVIEIGKNGEMYADKSAIIVDPVGNINHGNVNTTGDKNSGNVDTTVDENSENLDTTGDENRGNVYTAGNENSGKVDTAGDELSRNADTTGNEHGGNVDTTGYENDRNVDTADNENSKSIDATVLENNEIVNSTGNMNRGTPAYDRCANFVASLSEDSANEGTIETDGIEL